MTKCFMFLSVVLIVFGFFCTDLLVDDLLADDTETQEPLLIELFTSQGCSSCPPADRLLGTLHERFSSRAKALVLSYHVDYWNYLGWGDPYSFPAASKLQRTLAQKLSSGVFTPQIVVNGKVSTVGSRLSEVNNEIERVGNGAGSGVFKEVVSNGDQVQVELTQDGPYLLFVVGFRTMVSNSVPRGENAGKQLHHTNTVRSLQVLPIDARSMSLTLTAPNSTGEELSWALILRNRATYEVVDLWKLSR
ncbi:MAG: DUF1223 domain-containing protein [Bdellovibrionales bacterium]|nr:DUF1223 domain-containing protein [Bdellovibrionales bacterium]